MAGSPFHADHFHHFKNCNLQTDMKSFKDTLKFNILILSYKSSLYSRVGRIFSKWWDWLCSLELRTPLGKVTLMQNLRTLGCVTTCHGALKVFPKRYIRSKFQSCQIELKLKMQSLLSLLISKMPRLSILTHKCGIYLSLIHIWRCRRYSLCRSRWSPYH